jgi:hypothetical protein
VVLQTVLGVCSCPVLSHGQSMPNFAFAPPTSLAPLRAAIHPRAEARSLLAVCVIPVPLGQPSERRAFFFCPATKNFV